MVNFGSTNQVHCDPNDCGLTMILILTTQPRHFLCMPEIGLKFSIENGSIVAIASAYVKHFVWGTQTPKERYSLIFISQRKTAKEFDIPLPPLC